MRTESVGRTIWRVFYPVLIFLGVDIVISTVVTFGYTIYATLQMGPQMEMTAEAYAALTNDIMNFIYSIAIYLTLIRSVLIIPFYIMFMRKDIKRDVEFGRPTAYTPYNKLWLLILPVMGIVMCLAFNNLVVMMMDLVEDGINALMDSMDINYDFDAFASFEESSSLIYSSHIVVQILVTSIAAPLVEELLFRGIVYKRLRTIMNITPAMIISAALFGLVHGNMVQFIYAFLIGLIFAFVYEKFKTIWAPIILHASANLLSVIITALQGSETSDGSEGTIGMYMLFAVIELAVTFLFVWLIDRKVNRTPLKQENTGINNNQEA